MCRNPFHKSLITIQQSSIERPSKLFIFPFAPPPPPPSCGDPLCGEVCGVGEVSTSSFHFDNLGKILFFVFFDIFQENNQGHILLIVIVNVMTDLRGNRLQMYWKSMLPDPSLC